MIGTSHRAEYFPAIDGLRAVAVLAVIAFHFGELVPAGFVGVDIFFVISGFVVAGAALAHQDRTITGFLLGFYSRRVLRIVPALLTCVVLSFLLMVLFVPIGAEGRFTERAVMTGFAALLGLSNFVLASSAGDYWSPASELNPFTHTWSLAVEEQFYLVVPLLLLIYLRGRRALVATMLLVLSAASVAFAVRWGTDTPKNAFYLLPSRFWELATGVGLFMSISWWRPRLAGVSGFACGLLGAALIAAANLRADAAAFPWPWALMPVLGTVMLIASVVAVPSSMLAKAMASSAALWIGKRSYAIYLWHWPLIVIARWTVGIDSPWILAAAFALTLLASQLSKVFVEDAARHAAQRFSWAGLRVVLVGGLGTTLAAASIAAAVALRPEGTLSVTSDQASWSSSTELPSTGCAIERDIRSFHGGHQYTLTPVDCAPAHRTIYVAGDSHAGAYIALLRKLASESGVKVVLYTRSGCSVLGLRRPVAEEQPACVEFVDAFFRQLESVVRENDDVFLPGLRVPRHVDYAGQPAKPVKFDITKSQAAAKDAAQRLEPIVRRGARVIMEAPKPVFRAPPFRCSDWFNKFNPACSVGFEVTRKEVEMLRAPVLESMRFIASRLDGVKIFDPVQTLCDADKCAAFKDGRPMFFDADHLSGYGNAVLYPSFTSVVGSLPGGEDHAARDHSGPSPDR